MKEVGMNKPKKISLFSVILIISIVLIVVLFLSLTFNQNFSLSGSSIQDSAGQEDQEILSEIEDLEDQNLTNDTNITLEEVNITNIIWENITIENGSNITISNETNITLDINETNITLEENITEEPNITLEGNDNNITIEENITLEENISISFDRDIDCHKCGKHKAPPLTNVNMTITAEFEGTLQNITLSDYYSNEWEVTNSNQGTIEQVNSTYNKISWFIESANDTIERSYVILSPQRTLPPTNYYLQTELEDKTSEWWRVIVSDPTEYEQLWVNYCDDWTLDWDNEYNNPYLDDSDSSYIHEVRTSNAIEGHFGFVNSTTDPSRVVSQVILYFECYGDDGDDGFDVWLDSGDGSGYLQIGLVTCTSTVDYIYETINITSRVNTWTEINNTFMYLSYQGNDDVWVRRAYMNITSNDPPTDDPPYWSSNQTSIPATYNPSTRSYFNITWEDETSVSTAWFGSNYTGSQDNYTMNEIATDIYNYSLVLGVGTYYWKSYANDSNNQWNTSDNWEFTIAQNTSNCQVLFNESSPLTYPSRFKVYTDCTSGYTLYRNGTTISNNSEQDLTVGVYNFTVSRTDQSNYSNYYDEEYFTIDKGTPSLGLDASPSWTETYPQETTVSVSGCPAQITCNLYRDDNLISSPPDVQTLGVGEYNYTYNTSGNANYTSYINSSNLTINQNTSNCQVLFNESSPNEYPNGFRVYTDCTSGYTLYRNGTTISNNSEQDLTVGVYNFTVSRTDQSNYSNVYDEENFEITQATTTCAIVFDKGSPQKYGTTINASCSCTNSEISETLWREDVNVTETENNQDIVLNAATHDYVCNVTASENYSSGTDSDSFTISQADNIVHLYLNDNEDQNLTIGYGTESNATAFTTAGTAYLY
ncbi:MAG: hypothetical protein JSW08_01330, partial [archaeon]